MIRGILANDEKRGLEVPRRQEIEQLRRQGSTWTIIESQRDVRAIDMDGIEGDRRFGRRWRGLRLGRSGTWFLRRDRGFRFLRV